LKKLATALGVLVGLWLVVLVVLGFVLDRGSGDRIAARMGEALQAQATVGDSDLALVRGHLALEKLSVRRSDAIGSLTLDVARVECDLPPFGFALFDRSCRELAVSGVRMEASTLQLFRLARPRRTPLHVSRVVINDARFSLAPSAIMPGLDAITLHIESVTAGPTTFKSPLSWLFALETLAMTIELPASVKIHLSYAGGILSASGSLFGSKPVTLPVALPVADAGADAKAELEALVAWAKHLATDLVAKKASDWLKSKLPF
jgi:hypothetical protein